ncbi:hypothetical protein [Methylobacterium symbioticum]|uniref:hypothetical protein n=1 Tax=Methylobacterium symbioticum TaxID=2584084 RepID=UPI00115901BB|nr:hypothetical protein [Methylobacterium symbioticum]
MATSLADLDGIVDPPYFEYLADIQPYMTIYNHLPPEAIFYAYLSFPNARKTTSRTISHCFKSSDATPTLFKSALGL